MNLAVLDARRFGLALLIAVVAATVGLLMSGPGSAGAQEASGEPPKPRGKIDVSVQAERFFVRDGQVVAEGPSTATFRGEDGATHTTGQQIPLQIDTANNCRVLELHLAELYLDLLGLQVRTSTINLRITGNRQETLGKLFCKLSEGLKLPNLTKAKRAVRSLNARLENRPLQLVAFTASIHQQTQDGAAATRQQAPPPPADACHVLDLLLGPLDLDLLGLVVELYGATEGDPVRVNVVADPNGGELGRTFCQLSGQQPAA